MQRARAILALAGLEADVDQGMSDEGEPWMALCRIDTGDVLLHVAVIDGKMVAEAANWPDPDPRMRALLDTIRSA